MAVEVRVYGGSDAVVRKHDDGTAIGDDTGTLIVYNEDGKQIAIYREWLSAEVVTSDG